MKNKTNNVYVHITADEPDITDEQIAFDKYTEEEYNSPYDEDYSDVMNVGGTFNEGDIFADR